MQALYFHEAKVLHNKILRTKFASSMWVSATPSSPPQMDPESFGWKLVNVSYQISWFDGEESPKVYTVLPRFIEHRI